MNKEDLNKKYELKVIYDIVTLRDFSVNLSPKVVKVYSVGIIKRESRGLNYKIFVDEISPKDFVLMAEKFDYTDFVSYLPEKFSHSFTYLNKINGYASSLSTMEDLPSFKKVDAESKRLKVSFDDMLSLYAKHEKEKKPALAHEIENMKSGIRASEERKISKISEEFTL